MTRTLDPCTSDATRRMGRTDRLKARVLEGPKTPTGYLAEAPPGAQKIARRRPIRDAGAATTPADAAAEASTADAGADASAADRDADSTPEPATDPQ